MSAYYNENDPKAAAWLRELIKEGHIAPGVVDERSIAEVRADDIYEYTQHHFFAGIGGWSLALRLAGWPDHVPVWTGSCPCQPFSAAGKGRGKRDPRHLWPAFRDLIEDAGPAVVFGEQVASKAGRRWLAGVRADLEALDYACGAADLCAAGVGAPHIRQRLWWVAYGDRQRLSRWAESHLGEVESAQHSPRWIDALRRSVIGGVADVPGAGSFPGSLAGIHRGEEGAWARDGELERRGDAGGLDDRSGERRDAGRHRDHGGNERVIASTNGSAGGLADTEHYGGRADESRRGEEGRVADGRIARGLVDSHGAGRSKQRGPFPMGAQYLAAERAAGGCWADFEIIPCADGKARRIESGTFPLAHGVPGRVGLLRGYGNAIVPETAAQFIAASIEALMEMEG